MVEGDPLEATADYDAAADVSPIELSAPAKLSIWTCIAGIFWIGLFPNTVLNLTNEAAKVFGN